MPVYWIDQAANEIVESGICQMLPEGTSEELYGIVAGAGWLIMDGIGYWFSNYDPAPALVGGNVVIYWYPKDDGGGGPPAP